MSEDKERAELIKKIHTLKIQINEQKSRVASYKKSIEETEYKIKKSKEDVENMSGIGLQIAEVLQCVGDDKFIVATQLGHHYLVNSRKGIDKARLFPTKSHTTTEDKKSADDEHEESLDEISERRRREREEGIAKKNEGRGIGTRVAIDAVTLTIMAVLPREVDVSVFNMVAEDPGKIGYNDIGGLHEQLREIREVIELPLTNPELFSRVGIKAPKGVLLYGPPGTGKTLLARAIAANMGDCTFLKIVASSIVDKYIGESSRVIREMFGYAREHAPCIIFMDEIDAIGVKRNEESNNADKEIHRVLMELLNQLDGFTELDRVKVIMATNRPDILDPALLRPGRLDRKIEIPLPNLAARTEIMRIHSGKMTIQGDVDFEAVVKLADGFNGADLRNICTEAGMFAIRAERDYVVEDDFMKAVRKLQEAKKLENPLSYGKV